MSEERQNMLARLAEAFSRAKMKACNSDHGSLIIERLMEESGYYIRKKRRASAAASKSASVDVLLGGG